MTTHPDAPSLKGSTLCDSPTPKPSWRTKLQKRAPEEPGKEKWRDATLSEKERWKDWQKAKDKEQARG
ncbi:hypothetical protein T440DRAFT_462872 [Plenodomus tracheiphilus IPT5]|uniref:Uncharacterized protein n=1 Tax=Plenodomus tracheiphilus IPT5 TaxID=1408161 RepID=A0A6A7BMF6_9PLEO|nr:hypothetical protein T440DRAFT_462872 [Plenodomus tracheiphilus IPT5]